MENIQNVNFTFKSERTLTLNAEVLLENIHNLRCLYNKLSEEDNRKLLRFESDCTLALDLIDINTYKSFDLLKEKINEKFNALPDSFEELNRRLRECIVRLYKNCSDGSLRAKNALKAHSEYDKRMKELIEEHQKEYEELVHEAQLSAEKLIQSGCDFLEVVIPHIATSRESIAEKQPDSFSPKEAFSKPRVKMTASLVMTPLISSFGVAVNERFAELIHLNKTVYSLDKGKFRKCQTKEEDRVITRLLVGSGPCCSSSYRELFGPGPYPSSVFLHPDKKELPFIMEKVGSLLNTLRNRSYDLYREEEIALFKKELGQLAWWFANGVPYERGSAAILEILLKALVATKGFKLSFSQRPDLMCLLSPDKNAPWVPYESLFIMDQIQPNTHYNK